MIAGSAALNAASAALRSPLAIASSTLRTELRSAERRALLTSVRRAIWRVALRADLVLAMALSFDLALAAGYPREAAGSCKKMSGGESLAATGEAYSAGARRGVNARQTPASGHPFGPHRVVAGDDRGAVGGRERRERRLHPRQRRIAMDMREQRLDARRPAACRRTACGS